MLVTIELGTRLGLNVHRDQWPTAPLLDSYESSGFSWVQVHNPAAPHARRPGALPQPRTCAARGACATACGSVSTAPDDVSIGTIEHDRAFDGLMDYAAEAGAQLVVYHGLAFPVGDAGEMRAAAEEQSLRRFVGRAEGLGLTIAIETSRPSTRRPRRP